MSDVCSFHDTNLAWWYEMTTVEFFCCLAFVFSCLVSSTFSEASFSKRCLYFWFLQLFFSALLHFTVWITVGWIDEFYDDCVLGTELMKEKKTLPQRWRGRIDVCEHKAFLRFWFDLIFLTPYFLYIFWPLFLFQNDHVFIFWMYLTYLSYLSYHTLPYHPYLLTYSLAPWG